MMKNQLGEVKYELSVLEKKVENLKILLKEREKDLGGEKNESM